MRKDDTELIRLLRIALKALISGRKELAFKLSERANKVMEDTNVT